MGRLPSMKKSISSFHRRTATQHDDWRKHLAAESRQRIVNKIMETLKRHIPSEGLQELRKIAVQFEERIFHGASGQPDYLRKISLEMLTMESRSQNSAVNSMPSSSASNNVQPPDPDKKDL